MARKTASDWVESLAGTVESMATKIHDTAVTETRKWTAEMITNTYLQPTGRKTFGGKTPDESILQTLGYEDMAEVPRLAAARELFAEGGEFAEGLRAGLLMAARMVADERYEL